MRIYLVEDHAPLREPLHRVLDATPGITVVGACGSALQAVREVPAADPDLVVMNDRLPDLDWFSLCWHLARIAPRVRVILHTLIVEEQDARLAELAGVSGHVLKDVRCTSLLQAIRGAFSV